ncbi:hypothetical protein [Catenulispora subtropica]|uniref:Secreted protein n=1 Tax=Catenulispora subtropica TaxID=450798 RepID=A0ABN2T2N9_9ACTN
MTLATGNPPTSAPAATGAGAVAQHPGPPAARRPRTDRRLGRTRVVLAVGALLFGAAGIISTQIRADGADDVKSHSGVLIQQAEQLYHDLSDADATSATIYLHVGEAPKELLQRYDDDLKGAQSTMLAATNEAGSDRAAKDALDRIAQQLPIYAKLNATAAANNLVGYPVGIRYLTQASNLMQGTILPQAQKLTDAEAKNLSAAEDTATQFPWPMIAVGALMLGGLIVIQVRESRRTNRVFSIGLLAATAALALSLMWAAAATSIQSSHVDQAKKKGSNQVSVLATARILSLQARTDEMLTLVARGTADDKETDFSGSTDAANNHTPGTEEKLAAALQSAGQIATDGTGRDLAGAAADDVDQWSKQHKMLRDLDAQNQYQKAVDSALGERDYVAPAPSAALSFGKLQADLDKAIAHAEDAFRSEAASGADALTGLEIGLGVLAVAMAAAVVVGLGRRLAEYH